MLPQTSTSTFTPSNADRAIAENLRDGFIRCRQGTLELFEAIDDSTFRHQVHPDFSPVGWHLGHIAYTEALWLLQHCAGMAPLRPQYHKLLAADGLPKSERVNLPEFPEIVAYLDEVRDRTFSYLEMAPISEQERLWRFILQHESQHTETIGFLLNLQRGPWQPTADSPASLVADRSESDDIEIPGGDFWQGNDRPDALDNERSSHLYSLPTYAIDRYPVTCAQYRQFIDARGYQTPAYWSPEGWNWVRTHQIDRPLYWTGDRTFDTHPVCGVSYYEAEAYARFAGKRLPTESEWEKAASWNPDGEIQQLYPWGDRFPTATHCNHDNAHPHTTPVDAYPQGASPYGCYDMLGNVWEWTASTFDRYPGFSAFPYRGYSQTYFDGEHRVLRGGSFVTRPWAMRCSFRNWYHPWIRQIFAGFRCARSL